MNVRAIFLMLLSAAALPASAGQSKLDAEFQALRTYCKADVERLCPNVAPGGGRIKECLMSQKEQMTVGCAQALQELAKMKKQ